jgi:hypothetical protein
MFAFVHFTATCSGSRRAKPILVNADPDLKYFLTVLRIRIRRIYMFLGLLDLDPDPVRGMDPDPNPDPSIIKQKKKKNLDSYCFVTAFRPSKSNKQKNFYLN